MSRPTGSLLLVVIVPLILLMLATAVIAFHSARELEESRAIVNMTNETLGQTQKLFILAQAGETSQRGYVITGDDQYLQPFAEAQAQIPQTIEALKELLSDSPAQLERLDTLSGYLQVKFTEMNQVIDVRRAKGFEESQKIVMNNSGFAAMQSIRSIVNDMLVAERALLEQRLSEAHFAEYRTFLITGILFVVLLLLGVGGGYIFIRNFDRLAIAENELEVKARLLQATLDTVAEGIGAFDGQSRLVASNRRFFELFKFPIAPNQSSTSLSDLVAFDQKAGGVFNEAVNLPAEESRPAVGVYERQDGQCLEVYRSLMQNGSVFTARDITESRNAEKLLRQAQKMETVGQLTGGVAHDFNNLLQIIMANLDLAIRNASDSAQERRLKDAMVGAERGSKLTRQLLAFARRQPLKPEPVNLARLVRDLTDLLRRTLGESIEIEETAAAGLWTAMVDRSQLENAIVNLAINARDAMPDGGRLTIEIGNAFLDEAYGRLHEDVRPGQYVMIAVTDTGTGMSKEVVSKAFDPFFSTKVEGKGTGLGLSMVYGFTKQSGGHVKIYSEQGVGTTVKLYLPRSLKIDIGNVVNADEIISGNGERILVVEDEAAVRAAVILMLQDLGYQPVEATNGMEALALLEKGEPVDLLFTDVVMPGGMQGRKLAQEAQALRPDLKVIFTSGYTENSIIHHGRLDDGVHLLSKPYRKEDLARKLRGVLYEGQVKAQSPAAAVSAPVEPGPELGAPQAEIQDRRLHGRIVFAEDDALVRMATIDMLEDFGHEVWAASDFATALDLIDTQKPDVLMVDVNLGKTDGRKLAIEAKQRMPKLKIIFATGRDPGDLTVLVPDARLLTKPYGMPELRAMFETVLAET